MSAVVFLCGAASVSTGAGDRKSQARAEARRDWNAPARGIILVGRERP